MIAGYPVPIRQAWGRRIDTPTPILVQITDIGLVHCRPRLRLEMASLPVTGPPTNDNQYLIEEVSERHLVRAHPSTIRERLGDVQARVVLCGHSHQQHLIQLPDGPLILNPGSVGCPSYDDPGNDPHVSESGSAHARYAVLDINEGQVSADMIAITYDWKSAVARAESNGRHDWANGLQTGWFMTNPGQRLFTSTVGTEGHC